MYIDTPVNKQYDSKKEQALKHLEELCLKSIKELKDIPELEQPTEEENQFIKRKIFRK